MIRDVPLLMGVSRMKCYLGRKAVVAALLLGLAGCGGGTGGLEPGIPENPVYTAPVMPDGMMKGTAVKRIPKPGTPGKTP